MRGSVVLAISFPTRGAEVAAVKYYVDGTEVAWESGGSRHYSKVWDSTSVTDGTHRIFAKARTADGQWVTSRVVSITVSNSPDALDATTDGVVIAAAGDIACDPQSSSFNEGAGTSTACRQKYTADLVEAITPDAVLNLGDAQYEYGDLSKFEASYERSWGSFKEKTWATAGGSHDFYGGGSWYAYFGDGAGPAPYMPYSFDIGNWHVVVLNSQCETPEVGGCGDGSRQLEWLRRDLAANRTACTLAVWHNARWSSGARHGSDPRTQPFVDELYAAGAEIILSAHDHHYERFAPQDADGSRDDVRGIVQFIVGTGGKSLESGWGEVERNSVARQRKTFGILKLTLRPAAYDWEFVPEADASYTDSGSTQCH